MHLNHITLFEGLYRNVKFVSFSRHIYIIFFKTTEDFFWNKKHAVCTPLFVRFYICFYQKENIGFIPKPKSIDKHSWDTTMQTFR